MAQKVRTGDVFQRTVKGPNYIAIGKAKIDGQVLVIASKNGTINKDGQARVGHEIVTTRRAKLGKKGTRPNLYAFKPSQIFQIHSNRPVDLKSVWEVGNADNLDVHVRKMNRRNGADTTATRLVD